jgi:hemerythrin-like domain-containing protein
MKRIEQLRPLSMEHHLSLVLANKAIKTAKHGDITEIKMLCQQIAEAFDTRWETHFIKEEHSIFSLFNAKYRSQLLSDAPEDAELVNQLISQHNQMRLMSTNMLNGHTEQLEAFGIMLRDHTRLEERRLFPLISDIFSIEELDTIKKQTNEAPAT